MQGPISDLLPRSKMGWLSDDLLLPRSSLVGGRGEVERPCGSMVPLTRQVPPERSRVLNGVLSGRMAGGEDDGVKPYSTDGGVVDVRNLPTGLEAVVSASKPTITRDRGRLLATRG